MIVHHMEVFHCVIPGKWHWVDNRAEPELPRYSATYNSEEKPPDLHFCRKVLAAWAMGAQVRLLPLLFGNESPFSKVNLGHLLFQNGIFWLKQ